MIDGFQKVVNKLIEERLEQIITSEEYVMYSELLHKDLDEKLTQFGKFDDEAKESSSSTTLKETSLIKYISKQN